MTKPKAKNKELPKCEICGKTITISLDDMPELPFILGDDDILPCICCECLGKHEEEVFEREEETARDLYRRTSKLPIEVIKESCNRTAIEAIINMLKMTEDEYIEHLRQNGQIPKKKE